MFPLSLVVRQSKGNIYYSIPCFFIVKGRFGLYLFFIE